MDHPHALKKLLGLAVVALPALAAGAASSGGPVACVKVLLGSATEKEILSAEAARRKCCRPGGNKYFTVGGDSMEGGENTGLVCSDLRSNSNLEVDMGKCNARCEEGGNCGGGNVVVDEENDEKDKEAGGVGKDSYRAVYECDDADLALPAGGEGPIDLTGIPSVGPIACVTVHDYEAYDGAHNISEQYGRLKCCQGPNPKKYFLLGGHYGEGRRNGLLCTDDPQKEFHDTFNDGKVYASTCSVACPGPDWSRDPEKWGWCGGGGDYQCLAIKAKCGRQRSLYSCDTDQKYTENMRLQDGRGSKHKNAVRQQPIKCVRMKNYAAPMGSQYPEENTGYWACCQGAEKKKYFALGGHSHAFKGNFTRGERGEFWGDMMLHNGIQCADTIEELYSDPEDGEVDSSYCNVGCSGWDFSSNPSHWGLCGGDGECADPQRPNTCAVYRSIYECGPDRKV